MSDNKPIYADNYHEPAVDQTFTGECRIEWGSGTIVNVESNGRVHIEDFRPSLQETVGGFPHLKLRGHPALAKGNVVGYRIVTRANDGYDGAPAKLKDLERRSKVRELVWAVPLEQRFDAAGKPGEQVPPHMVTGPATDVDPRAWNAEATQKAVAAPVATTDDSRPRASEARQWEPLNSDGRLNTGSYAVTASTWALNVAVESYAATVGGVPVAGGELEATAAQLLAIADRLQVTRYAAKATDRMENSHTRARGVVALACEAMRGRLSDHGLTDQWLQVVEATAEDFAGWAIRSAAAHVMGEEQATSPPVTQLTAEAPAEGPAEAPGEAAAVTAGPSCESRSHNGVVYQLDQMDAQACMAAITAVARAADEEQRKAMADWWDGSRHSNYIPDPAQFVGQAAGTAERVALPRKANGSADLQAAHLTDLRAFTDFVLDLAAQPF